MKRLAKKLTAAVLALTLVVGMCTSIYAASWGSYFGASQGWYEGAEGALSNASDTGWTATMTSIGYGGVWGAQVYKEGVSVKKGQKYTLSFTMSSSNCDKWVYIKVAEGETLAFADWVQLKKGTDTAYNKTFTAENNATSIYFGIGGEFGDREGVSTDTDAAIRYSKLSVKPTDGDSTLATKIELKNFKLADAVTKLAKVTGIKAKNNAAGKAKITWKKVANAKTYQVKVGTKSYTSKKATYTAKKLKKGKTYKVRVRAKATSGLKAGAWSKTVKVKIKK